MTIQYISHAHKIKKQLNKLENEVGIAGSKSTQTRDNRIYYTSLRLLFLTVMHLFMSTCLLSAVCGRYSGCSLVVSFDSIALLITGYFCTPQKASVGMYSRYDYLLLVYFLILPSLLHSSIYSIFFNNIPISVLFYCT